MNIAFNEFDCANGLHVIVHEDHSVPVAAIDVRYHTGSKNEQPGKTGFAHLFEHLMFDGSQNVGRGMFDRYLTSAGASNNAYTTHDETNYHILVPSNQIELALWLESDRMLQFAIQEISLRTQKDVVKEEKRQTEDNRPYGNLDTQMRALALDGGCYRWPIIGSMDDIDAATLGDVKEFYETYYTPNNATLCLAGDIDVARARQLVAKYFAGIPRGTTAIPPARYVHPPQTGERRKTLHEDVPAPAAFIAFHAPGEDHPDIPALDLLCSILGAGESSRVQRSLIYDLQIASDAGVYPDINEQHSLMYVYAIAARPETDAPTLEHALDAHLTAIQREGVSARELEKVKNQKETQLVHGAATVLGIADELTHAYVLNGDTNGVNEEIDKYLRVRAEDVCAAANTYFTRNNRSVIHYAPNNAGTMLDADDGGDGEFYEEGTE